MRRSEAQTQKAMSAPPAELLVSHLTAAEEFALGRGSLNFRERGKVLVVECVNSVQAVDLHGGDNLQIENVGPRNGMAAKQTLDLIGCVLGYGQDGKKHPQHRNRGEGVGRGAGPGNAPPIRDRGVKFAEDLQGHVKGRGPVTRRLQQGAGGSVLRRVSVQCVHEDVGVDDSRFNGHRRKCPAGEGGLRRPGATAAVRA